MRRAGCPPAPWRERIAAFVASKFRAQGVKAHQSIALVERIEAGTEHGMPFGELALEVLEQARTLDDGSVLIFASPIRSGHNLADQLIAAGQSRRRTQSRL